MVKRRKKMKLNEQKHFYHFRFNTTAWLETQSGSCTTWSSICQSSISVIHRWPLSPTLSLMKIRYHQTTFFNVVTMKFCKWRAWLFFSAECPICQSSSEQIWLNRGLGGGYSLQWKQAGPFFQLPSLQRRSWSLHRVFWPGLHNLSWLASIKSSNNSF